MWKSKAPTENAYRPDRYEELFDTVTSLQKQVDEPKTQVKDLESAAVARDSNSHLERPQEPLGMFFHKNEEPIANFPLTLGDFQDLIDCGIIDPRKIRLQLICGLSGEGLKEF